MNSLEFWSSYLAQTLLRGMGWLLFILLIATLLRRTSAARRALVWQMTFAGLLLLPILLLSMPPVSLPQSDPPIPSAVPAEKPISVSASHHQSTSSNAPLPPFASPEQTLPASSPAAYPSPDPRRERPVMRASRSLHDGPADRMLPTHPALVTKQPSPAVSPAALLGSLPTLPKVSRLLFWGWSLGAVWSLLSLLVNLSALRRLGRGAVALAPELLLEEREMADRLGLRCRVALWRSVPESSLYAPVTWGIFRPVVMMPAAYPQETPARRRVALLHELAHVRRGDWAWLLLAQIVCALYWCVPFVWLAARRLRHEIELACDDCVLATVISAPDYAAQILEIARILKLRSARLPIHALTMARPPLAQVRIQAILDSHHRRQPASRYALALAGLLPALCIPVLSLRAVEASEAQVKTGTSSWNSGTTLPASASEALSTPPLADVRTAETTPTSPGSSLRFAQPDTQGALQTPKTAFPPGSPGGIPFLSNLPLLGRLFQIEPPKVHTETPKRGIPLLKDLPIVGKMFQIPPSEEGVSWGKAQKGLQAGIRFRENRKRYFNGETLEAEILIRNVGKNEVAFDLETGKTPAGHYTIVTQAMKTRILGSSLGYTVHTPTAVLKPGETVVVASFQLETSPVASLHTRPLLVTEGGSFELAQNEKVRLTGERGEALTLQSGSIPFEIVSTAMLARWGNAEHGLQLGLAIRGNRQKFEIGETVQMDLYWRNATEKPLTVSYALYAPYDFTPDLETSSGSRAEVITTFIDIKPHKTSVTLKSGETIWIAQPRLLLVRQKQEGIETLGIVKPDWYRIRQSCSVAPYEGKVPANPVVLDGTRPQSGTVSFEVVENRPQEKQIYWGEEARGFQLGARIVPERSTFKIGDTIKFQAFGRNLTDKDQELTIGNYWKVNYKVQIQTLDGRPIYMERDARNRAELIAGYLGDSLGKGATQEISEAQLKVVREPLNKNAVTSDTEEWVEAVPLPPGRYRVRLLSWSLFGREKPEPASGWIPIEIKAE
jgi:beta-lactamase regulating signal transducer with metallopeptidase domain